MLREFSVYAGEYMAAATQLATYRLAREWMGVGVAAADAAQWASQGFLPDEAAPLIAVGVTPQLVGELDDIAIDMAGSPEERAAQFVARLLAEGYEFPRPTP